MTIFNLLIFNQDEDYQFINHEGIQSLGYQELVTTANSLNLDGTTKAIKGMWLKLIDLGIEQKSQFRVFGSPLPLFNLLNDIFEFQLSYRSIKKCLKCSKIEKETTNSLPILIQVECGLTNFVDIDFGVEIDSILEDKLEECLSCKTSNSLL